MSISTTPNTQGQAPAVELDVDAWRRDGFLHVPGVFDADRLAELRSWVDDVATRPYGDGGLLQHYEVGDAGPQIARSENLLDHGGFRDLIAQGTLVEMGGRLLGEPIVLYKEKINYKLSGGAGFVAHQDAPAYKFVDMHLTCMVAIDDATLDNGCLEAVAGLHDELLPDDGDGCVDPNVAVGLDWLALPMRAGDLLWFHSLAPHRSGPNLTSTTRRALFCTYNAAREGDLREQYYADKLRYFAETGAPSTRVSTVGGFDGIEPTVEQLREIGALS